MPATQQTVRKLFDCNPDSGKLIRLVACGTRGAIGSEAGTIAHDGYRVVRIDGKSYQAHRLVWLYVYGVMPISGIDHIDGNRSNNSISNLREATHAENNQNRRNPNKNNTSGFLGVSFHRGRGKYVAKIKIDKKIKNLGDFRNPEDASSAYLSAKKKYHPFQTIS